MEIILKQDIPGLGFANDLIEVKNGYARNYLIPQGMAIMATESNKKVREEDLKQRAFKAEKEQKEAKEFAQKLENIKVNIGAKAGTTGKIFGSVNNLQIADAIKEQHGIEVDRKKILVKGESVKELGTYKAKIILHKEVTVEIDFEVIAE